MLLGYIVVIDVVGDVFYNSINKFGVQRQHFSFLGIENGRALHRIYCLVGVDPTAKRVTIRLALPEHIVVAYVGEVEHPLHQAPHRGSPP